MGTEESFEIEFEDVYSIAEYSKRVESPEYDRLMQCRKHTTGS